MTAPDFTFSAEKNRVEAWPDGRAFLLYVVAVAEQIILEQTKKHAFLDDLRREEVETWLAEKRAKDIPR